MSGGAGRSRGPVKPLPAPARRARDHVPRVVVDPTLPPPAGRARRLAERRSRVRRRKLAALALLTAAVALTAAIGGLAAVRSSRWRAAAPAGADPQATVLLALTSGGQPHTLLLAGVDARHAGGTLLFVPPQTLALLPGVGSGAVGSSLRYGGLPLLATATENLLRVRLDATAALDDAGLARLVDRLGGLDVPIPSRVVVRHPDGSRTLAFGVGPTHLDGAQAALLGELAGEGETTLDRYPRVQALWSALLQRGHADPAALAGALDAAAPAGDSAGLARTLLGLAQAPLAGLDFQLLPVRANAGGSFVVADDQARPLLADGFAPSLLPGGDAGMRVQVLNGAGPPAAGAEVASRLVNAGFTLPVGGNADHFGYRRTRIVVYDDGPAALALAQRVRAALGVGTVEVSESPQSVVDVTVVVGEDLLHPPAT